MKGIARGPLKFYRPPKKRVVTKARVSKHVGAKQPKGG